MLLAIVDSKSIVHRGRDHVRVARRLNIDFRIADHHRVAGVLHLDALAEAFTGAGFDDAQAVGDRLLRHGAEIQRQREGYLALELDDARRFDFGTPDDFVRSLHEFRANP